MEKPTAILLTDSCLDTLQGKTAHGMILGSSRYNILAVVDQKHAGGDAGVVIDGLNRNIPIYRDVVEALQHLNTKPKYCVIAIAPSGGKLTQTLTVEIKSAIVNKLNIVSGLHTLLNKQDEFAKLSAQHNVELIDIRKQKCVDELHMWCGKIAEVKTPRIAVLGMDCAIGKRTTCHTLLELCKENNINAQMIYTGQTGWLQGYDYGFVFDSTINDFVSGEMEHQITRCVADLNPDLILIEGQSSLRNPSGPCGAEMILSAGAKYVILHHIPGREYFISDKYQTHKIPSLQEEIDLIKLYGAEVIAVTMNVTELKNSDIEAVSVPVIRPREQGLDSLIPIIKNILVQS